MKIVVLDGFTVNPGDLGWDALKALGELKVHDRTAEDDVPKRVGDAEILLTCKTHLNRETIRKLARLKYIGVLATGYKMINVDAAHKRGITVTHVPDYCTAAVAEMVFALLFELTRRVSYHAHTVRKGRWSRNPDYCYWLAARSTRGSYDRHCGFRPHWAGRGAARPMLRHERIDPFSTHEARRVSGRTFRRSGNFAPRKRRRFSALPAIARDRGTHECGTNRSHETNRVSH